MNITEDMVRDAVEAFLANTGQAHKVTDLQRELATTCMRPALEAALSAQPVTISTGTMKESNGRVTHMTIVRRGDAWIEDGHTSYLGRAEFNTARWEHVLLGHPEPDILAFDTDTRSGTDSPQPAAEAHGGGEAVAWQHPDTLPPVEPGQCGWFWVAVRRANNGRIYSFPATYLNAMVLTDENCDQEESRGNRYHHGPVDEDDGTFEATGWHDAKEHSEYSAIYLPLLDSDKDELVAWRAVADYGDTAPPSAPVETEGLMQLAREWCLSWGEWAHDNDPDCKKENAAEAALRAALTAAFAQQPAACPKCGGTGEADSGGIMPWGAPAMIPCDCKQPAAVDGAMVERALAAYLRRQEDGESLYGCVTAALTAALAGQQQGGA